VMGRAWQGKGYGTEASRAVLAAAYAAGYERVTAITEPGNAIALHVLERLGMPYLRDVEWDGKTYRLHALEAGAEAVAPVR
jgi:RimJ/RimL family protein N-acetyltransferase